MNVPTGYTALDLVGFTDKGAYSSSASYVKNDLVDYGGDKWQCMDDDVSNVTPTEGAYWHKWIDMPDESGKADISAIGTNETGTTASRAYTVGEHFYKSGKFCTVIAAIAQGAQFTLNTNYVEGDISDFLTIKTHEFTPVATYFSGQYAKTIYKYGRVGIADISGIANTSIPANTFTTIGNITNTDFLPLFECNVAESSSFLGKMRITETGVIRINPNQSVSSNTIISVQIPMIFAK